MRRQIGLLLFTCTLACLAGCHSIHSQAEPPSPQDPEILKLGEKVYKTHCRACHLPNGRSRVKRLNLADDEWMHCDGEIEQITRIVSNGVEATQMQSFKELLSQEEIEAVAVFVKGLSKKE